MKILNLTPKQLATIVNNNEFIGNGSFGLVVKFSHDLLLKFNYKEFIDAFHEENNKIDLRQLGDISTIIESRKEINQIIYHDIEPDRVKMIKLLISKQPDIKISTLTQGLVYVNNYCVGYLLKYHQNMIDLYEYQNTINISNCEKSNILQKIKVSMNELIQNHIYLEDFTTWNILYNPITKQVELIDFEDSVICSEERDVLAEERMLDKYADIEKLFNIDNQYDDTLEI